jgi:hypothetical protein
MHSGWVISNVGSLRTFRLILPLLVVTLHSPIAQAQTPNDHLIVPRERIGPLTLGMSAAELAQTMGNPSSRRPGEVDLYS